MAAIMQMRKTLVQYLSPRLGAVEATCDIQRKSSHSHI
jgi:hypothetical protein